MRYVWSKALPAISSSSHFSSALASTTTAKYGCIHPPLTHTSTHNGEGVLCCKFFQHEEQFELVSSSPSALARSHSIDIVVIIIDIIIVIIIDVIIDISAVVAECGFQSSKPPQ